MTQKEIALQYLRRGLPVFPIKSPAMMQRGYPKELIERIDQLIAENATEDTTLKEFIRKCKTPLVPWKPLQGRLPSEEEVSRWFESFPQATSQL